MSRVPIQLRASLAALVMLMGAGGGAYYVDEAATREANTNAYIQAVAADPEVSDGIRIAMVMASFYESSNRHIGTPYVDKLGKGQPLTVCNGLTGPEVVAGRTYTPADCYRLEKRRYIGYEVEAKRLLTHWASYDPFQQATFLDFLHNKGEGNFIGSTMRRKANAGDWVGACRENTRWNRGTVQGVSTVLPGLQLRGDANGEICTSWRLGVHK
ncbi:endolysin [Acidovorax sp. ACV02]|uniref:glycoside hydrolase family protein n=1 Tax=Acidovorax sp. ACV02 TaxID=2769310 RepID=UPI00177ECAB6|nr:endolysin [Acidovorax sp. ACV02]